MSYEIGGQEYADWDKCSVCGLPTDVCTRNLLKKYLQEGMPMEQLTWRFSTWEIKEATEQLAFENGDYQI